MRMRLRLRATVDQLLSGQIEYTLNEFCDDLREWVRLNTYTSRSSIVKQNKALAGELTFELYFSLYFLTAVGQDLDQLYGVHQEVTPFVPLEFLRSVADDHTEDIEVLKVILANQTLDNIENGMSEEESLKVLNVYVKDIITNGSHSEQGKVLN